MLAIIYLLIFFSLAAGAEMILNEFVFKFQFGTLNKWSYFEIWIRYFKILTLKKNKTTGSVQSYIFE